MATTQILFAEMILMGCAVLVGCDKTPISSTQEFHAIHPGAREIVSEEFRLVNMTIEILVSEVQYQSSVFENQVSFDDALRTALTSFMEDGTDLESPLGLVKDDFSGISEKERKAILFDFINRSDTILRLVAPDTETGFPERGEAIQENWVFQLRMPSYSDHLQWAIVDRLGKQPTYNYGFN
jgi:hypothetical protein